MVVPIPLLLNLLSVPARPHTLGGLHLVAHVGMPLYTAHIVLDHIVHSSSREVAIDGKKLRISLDLTTHLVDVQGTEMRAKLPLSVLSDVCEVLAPEDYHATLGSQQCQRILLLAAQAAQLQIVNLGSDCRGDFIEDRSGSVQQCLVLGICS